MICVLQKLLGFVERRAAMDRDAQKTEDGAGQDVNSRVVVHEDIPAAWRDGVALHHVQHPAQIGRKFGDSSSVSMMMWTGCKAVLTILRSSVG